jgi:hypothetical protein
MHACTPTTRHGFAREAYRCHRSLHPRTCSAQVKRRSRKSESSRQTMIAHVRLRPHRRRSQTSIQCGKADCRREAVRPCAHLTLEMTGDRRTGAVRRTPLDVRVEQPVRPHRRLALRYVKRGIAVRAVCVELQLREWCCRPHFLGPRWTPGASRSHTSANRCYREMLHAPGEGPATNRRAPLPPSEGKSGRGKRSFLTRTTEARASPSERVQRSHKFDLAQEQEAPIRRRRDAAVYRRVRAECGIHTKLPDPA